MPTGVYLHKKEYKRPPLSLEWRKKISEALKGRRLSEETRRKISESHKGKHFSPETEFKKGHRRGMLGKHHSEETKLKIGKKNKGRKFTEEARRKISKALKGKPRSEEIRRKLSETHKGEKNPNWQGGVSFQPYSIDWTQTLKRAIRERDKYICQLCYSYGNEVHHIDYDKKNCNPNNLITLCRKCHMKTNYNREYWKNYFWRKVKVVS